MSARDVAGARFEAESARGHYESWFVRANHPARPLAFWSRYTVFAPRGRPEEATAELWGVWFDGERDEVVAAREDVSLRRSAFAESALDVRIGAAHLDAERAGGSATLGAAKVSWDVEWSGGGASLVFLPELLHRAPFPTAKSVVLAPGARFTGTFTVRDEAHAIDGWIGSVNHNWGKRHTDEYAWGQLAELEGAPGSFVEVITARVALVPRWRLRTPWVTLVLLHLDGRTHRLVSVHRSADGAPYEVGAWRFEARGLGVEVEGELRAPRERFVALEYRNPPGGVKICHNTKIGSASVTVREGGRARVFRSESRAAFEVLADRVAPGVRLVR